MSEQELADQATIKGQAWRLVSFTSRVCKPLLWLRDTDSCLPLACALLPDLRGALYEVISFGGAVEALCHKMDTIYEKALDKQWVGIGAQPRSSRLGDRTKKNGLLHALDYAEGEGRKKFEDACDKAKNDQDWESLFSLTKTFINSLDWKEHVIENTRGQATSLVLESIELLEAIEQGKDQEEIEEEIGDVFYNLMACCLSLKIEAEHIA